MTRASETNLAICDGRDLLGALVQRGKSWDTFDLAGRHLGTFPSVKAASAAIEPSSRLVFCVRDHQRERGGGGGN